MSAIQRFHEVANDALVTISEHLKPEAKLALIIYTPGEPEQDILLKGPAVEADEVLNTLRRRGGLSLDGDNAYKRGICDVAVGAMASGKQNNNPPSEGHWGQRFWDIGRAEGQQRDDLVAALQHLNDSAWKKARVRAAKLWQEQHLRPAHPGFASIRIHDLKHTFGRRLKAAGVSEEDRKSLLGHKNGSVTSHYSGAEIGQLIEAANKVSATDSRGPVLTILKRRIG